MTNRRGFLSAIAAAVAGATLDPERLLWRPGAKLISVPKPRPVQIGTVLHVRVPMRFHNECFAFTMPVKTPVRYNPATYPDRESFEAAMRRHG